MIVMTPLGIEMKFLVAAFREQKLAIEQDSVGSMTIYRVPALKLTLVRGAHGKVGCALKTQEAIHAMPDAEGVICAGAAGRLSKDLQVGDVVVGLETIEHDYHERFTQAPHPSFIGHPEMIEKLKKIAGNKSFVHLGRIASGDEDIIDEKRAAELHERTKAIAVAWEGAGVGRACQHHDKPFLEIRGITDGADGNAMAHFQENIQLVMWNIASVLVDLRHSRVANKKTT